MHMYVQGRRFVSDVMRCILLWVSGWFTQITATGTNIQQRLCRLLSARSVVNVFDGGS